MPQAAPPPTVMPQALSEARPAVAEPRERRSRFPLIVVGAVLVAAVAGFLLAGSGGGEDPGGEATTAENDAIQLEVPAGWTRATTLPAVPGLTLDGATGYTAPDGGALMFGTVSENANNSTLLPTGLIQAAGGVPEQRTPVALGPDKLQAYRYSDIEVEGLDQPLTVYAVPTSEGVATVACLPGSASCEGAANTLELTAGEPLPVGPSGQYAKAVEDALGDLSSSAALRRAKTPRAQAAAARDLQAAYRRASQALGGQQVNPADACANARLVGRARRRLEGLRPGGLRGRGRQQAAVPAGRQGRDRGPAGPRRRSPRVARRGLRNRILRSEAHGTPPDRHHRRRRDRRLRRRLRDRQAGRRRGGGGRRRAGRARRGVRRADGGDHRRRRVREPARAQAQADARGGAARAEHRGGRPVDVDCLARSGARRSGAGARAWAGHRRR